jgi:O-succinylbenzoate synthase
LLDKIKPQYIILKPSLIGGFRGTLEWIALAKKRNIGWWMTSALESNIGLNAIAQFTFTLNTKMPQGLGTGSLYTNNFDCPLDVENGQLWYRNNLEWKVELM